MAREATVPRIELPAWPPVVLSAALGFALAFAIVLYPLPGMAAPVAVGALLLASRQPQWLMLAFFTSLAIPIQRSLAGVPVNAADALLVLWCVLWPLMMQREGAPPLSRWRLPPLVLLIAPFLASVIVSQLGSINPGASLKQVFRLVEWFVVLPLVLTVFVPDPRFRRFAGVMLMVVPCVFAIDGIVEYFSNGRTLTGMIGIPVPVPEGGAGQIRHTYDVSGRAGSSFGGAQGLAMYLVMTMGFAIAHLLYPPAPWMRRLAIPCLLISIGGLAVAQSRGGVMGALALVLAMALLVRARLRLPFVLASAFLLALALVGLGLWPAWDGTIAGLVPGGRPEAVLDRLIIWGVVRDVMLDNPFFGVGLGNFRDAFFAREPWLHVELAYQSLHAHNTYLEILADTGWVGLCAYLAFLIGAVRRLVRQWSLGGQPALTLAAVGSLAAYAVFAMVDMLLLQNMHLLLVLVLSIGLAQLDEAKRGTGPVAARASP
ncbi:MAG TPA: O-antigen ligase family protein [Albitalea sp.]|uniref:O-antigen ligase family protein n=1 Tax=Piscinibacter sp. TaxID=1903157 RepID=UPI002ED0A3A1